LPLAHASDQLRIVIPDGREDLSLAAAFEVGRLLTLSQPSIISSLMRWRQGHYHAARLACMIESNRPFWEDILGADFNVRDFQHLGPLAGRFFVEGIVQNPEVYLGAPRPRVTPGRAIGIAGLPSDSLADGLGIDKTIFKGDIGSVFDKVRELPTPSLDLKVDDIGAVGIRERLELSLDSQRVDLVSNTLRNRFTIDAVAGPAFPVTQLLLDDVVIADTPIAPDLFDDILAASITDEED